MILQGVSLGVNATNCYLLMDEKTGKAAVVDPGSYDNNLLRLLETHNARNLEYILLTHGHYDHILGVSELRKKTGAAVAIHSFDASCLSDETQSLAVHLGYGIQQPIDADIILEDGAKLSLGDCVIEVLYTPGHTRGGVCFLVESDRLLLTGDTLFRGTVGRADLPGGDYKVLLDSVSRLAALQGDYAVYPGHNKATTLDFERLHNRYMRKTV